jgi:hypothetical protein
MIFATAGMVCVSAQLSGAHYAKKAELRMAAAGPELRQVRC